MKQLTPPAFWRNAKTRYTMTGSRCKTCNHIAYPIRNPCANCGSKQTEEIMLSGKGKLISWTTIKAAPEGFEAPYIVGMIQLKEGPVFTAQVVSPEHEMRQDAEVRAVFRKLIETEDSLLVYGTKFEIIDHI